MYVKGLKMAIKKYSTGKINSVIDDKKDLTEEQIEKVADLLENYKEKKDGYDKNLGSN